MGKNSLTHRLHIIGGQINGLVNLIEQNSDCRKVTEQFYAVNFGLKKVMELYLKENLESCFRPSVLKDRKRIEFLIKEIIKNK